MSIKDAFAFGLNLEKSIMNDTSFTRFKKQDS